ncbi:hypothetical protein HDU96_009854 [Phlyctochytrium bullatum]|nr:hypothetical protein HDU96_009854 [Phlyctochytrium bullatum]
MQHLLRYLLLVVLALSAAGVSSIVVALPSAAPADNVATSTSSANPLSRRDLGLVDWKWVDVPGRLRQIDVSENGNLVVGVNSNDDIYRYDNGQWTKLPGMLKHVTACDDGSLWGVNRNNKIFYSSNPNGNWIEIGGRLTQIDCGSRGVWGIGLANDIFKWNGVWTNVGGVLKQISSGAQGVWGVTSANEIFRLSDDGVTWRKIDGWLNYISSGRNYVWGTNANDDVFYYNRFSNTWYQYPGALRTVAVAPSILYGTNKDNFIYALPIPEYRIDAIVAQDSVDIGSPELTMIADIANEMRRGCNDRGCDYSNGYYAWVTSKIFFETSQYLWCTWSVKAEFNGALEKNDLIYTFEKFMPGAAKYVIDDSSSFLVWDWPKGLRLTAWDNASGNRRGSLRFDISCSGGPHSNTCPKWLDVAAQGIMLIPHPAASIVGGAVSVTCGVIDLAGNSAGFGADDATAEVQNPCDKMLNDPPTTYDEYFKLETACVALAAAKNSTAS